jgi:tetraacyldisaccharide 4'-kinase
MKYLRWLLFPFSLIYGLVIIIRNWCYDAGIFKSREFDIPVISVGNLEVGGAGKSPMTEYLIGLFKDRYKLSTLSRGYGRETKGFLIADESSTAAQIGDEPAQFKQKFPDVTVAVCEKRVEGISRLIPDHELIILDDAYQHRAVKPGFSILLFDFSKITGSQLLLPTGYLREPFSGRWRADIIVITKCPEKLTRDHQQIIAEKVAPLPYQTLFFNTISYKSLQSINNYGQTEVIDSDTIAFVITGIANPKPLLDHVEKLTTQIVHHNYPDHHRFSLKNITKLAAEFAACNSQKKIIITTEKDAQRLGERAIKQIINELPVYVIPIGIEFFNNDGPLFDQIVRNYVRENTANHRLH